MKLHEEALGGLSAGVVGTVIGYPLDLIKTRMQTSSSNDGMRRLGVSIFRQEGLSALYKGMAPALISLSLLNTMNFTSYSHFRTVYNASRGWDYRNAVAGATAAPLGSMISTVEHMIKTQMQVDNVSGKRYVSSYHCLTSILRHSPSSPLTGLRLLYTGHGVNTVREGVFLATYFYAYEGLREQGGNSRWVIPVAGGLSGALAWFVSFPLDCIKAGIQGRPVGDRIGAWMVATNLLREKGVAGLYSGVTPSLVRSFLVSGSRFSAYEFALWVLRGGEDGERIEIRS